MQALRNKLQCHGEKLCLVVTASLILIVEDVFKSADKGPCCLLADQLFTGRASYLDICDIILNQNMRTN